MFSRSYENFLRTVTWQTNYVLRACPPDAVLFAEKSEELDAHVALCPFCLERLEHRDEWLELGAATTTPVSTSEPDRVEAGQVWRLSPRLAGWGPGNRYYNPPLVLVLQVMDLPVRIAQVAQISTNDMLLLADDLKIESKFGIVEAWNIYTVSIHDLHLYWGVTDPVNVAKTLRLAELEAEVDDAEVEFFRELELDVAYFFSCQSSALALEEMESAEDMIALRQASPTWKFPESAQDLPTFVAMATPPAWELPLAAASENVLEVKVMRWTNHGVELSMTTAQLVDLRTSNEHVHFHYRLDDSVEDVQDVRIWLSNGDVLPVEEVDFEQPFFSFVIPESESGVETRIIVVLVCHETTEY